MPATSFALSGWRIALLCNSAYYPLLTNLIGSIAEHRIVSLSGIHVGDVGLTPEEKHCITLIGAQVHPTDHHDLGHGLVSQTERYRSLIRCRPHLLARLAYENSGPILMLDVDSEFVGSDFSQLDRSATVTFSCRHLGPGDSVTGRDEPFHIAPGATFFHQPIEIRHFFWKWIEAQEILPPHPGKYEQRNIYHAMTTLPRARVQYVHSRYYCCYKPSWVIPQTSIVQFKAGGLLGTDPLKRLAKWKEMTKR